MIFQDELIGSYITLKSVNLDDAEFILGLRLNKKYNKFIHSTDNNVLKQREWIKSQQERDGDYYFIIKNIKNQPIGLISIYNIVKGSAECGRWISEGNAFENLEAVKILHDFGFYKLGLKEIYTCTVRENTTVVNFWKRFGGSFEGFTSSESFVLYKNLVKDKLYNEEICKKINRLLYK